MRGIETLKGPGARDREGRPAFIVIGGREHLLRHGLRAPVARKTPAPIETQGPGPKGRGLGPPQGIAGPPSTQARARSAVGEAPTTARMGKRPSATASGSRQSARPAEEKPGRGSAAA